MQLQAWVDGGWWLMLCTHRKVNVKHSEKSTPQRRDQSTKKLLGIEIVPKDRAHKSQCKLCFRNQVCFFFFFRMHIQASCSYFQLISINFWDTIETSRNCKRTWGACPMLLCFNMTMTSALLPDLPDGSSAFQSLRRPGKPGFSWTASPVIRWRRQVSENNWRTEPSPWPSAQNGELLGDLLED